MDPGDPDSGSTAVGQLADSAVLDAVPVGVVQLDHHGRFSYANRAARWILRLPPTFVGRTREELGLRVLTLEGHERRPEDDLIEAMQSGEPTLGVERVLVAADGTRRIVMFDATPLPAADGSGPGVVVAITDVTEEHERRTALAENRARYQALFERNADGIALLNNDGVYLDVNPEAARLLDQEASEVVGRTIEEVLAPLLGAVEAANLQREWLRFVTASGTGVTASTERGLSVPGAWGHGVEEVELRSTTNIRPGLHQVILRDRTDRRRAELAVTSSQEQFRRLADGSADGIYRMALGDQPTYEYVNASLERITGLAAADILADPGLLNAHTHPDDQIGDGNAQPAVIRFVRGDGERRWLEVHQIRITDADGRGVALQGSVRDVTEERKRGDALAAALRREQDAARQLRMVDEMKDALLRAVSHEVRTPLTSVHGLAATLHANLDRMAPVQVRHLLERLMANSDRLEKLLEDLLDLGRFAKGTYKPDRRPVDLANLARAAAEFVDLGPRRLQLDLIPTPATVEPELVNRAIDNLLANAARHTPEDATVWVRTWLDSRTGVAHVVVEDNGPGWPDTGPDVLFAPFVQGPLASTAPQPGTGVGLNLVHQFTLAHGGRVHADTSPHGGARIHLEFPPPDA